MARFYADENFPVPAVEELRQRGHDVLTTAEAGQANVAMPDAVVLAFATSKQRAGLSHNRRHFLRLHHETNGRHAGLCLCTFDPDFTALAKHIDAAVKAEGGELGGKVVRIYRGQEIG